MPHPVRKVAVGEDDDAAAVERCGRVAKALALSVAGLAMVYFGALFMLSR